MGKRNTGDEGHSGKGEKSDKGRGGSIKLNYMGNHMKFCLLES